MNDKDVSASLSRVQIGPLIGWYMAVSEAECQEQWLLPSLNMTNRRKWSHLTSDRTRGLQGCQHPWQAREGGNSLISRLEMPLDSCMTLRRGTLKMIETEFLTSCLRVGA